MQVTDYSTLFGIVSEENEYGLYLINSAHNLIKSSVFALNNQTSIYSDNSGNNTIQKNVMFGNKRNGVFLTTFNAPKGSLIENIICYNQLRDIDDSTSFSFPDVGFNNTCDTTFGWNDNGTSGCTFNCGLRVMGVATDGHTHPLRSLNITLYWNN